MSVNAMSVSRSGALYASLVATLSVVVAFVAYNQSLFELVRRWNTQEEYSHGYFIPAITAWLLWTRRDAIIGSIGRPSWLGPALILLAMAMHGHEHRCLLHFTSGLAISLYEKLF